MHGGMLERDRGVGWRTGSTRVPLTGETTNEGQGSLRSRAIRRSRCTGTFRRTRTFFATMQGHTATGPGKRRSYAPLAAFPLLLITAGCATVPDADEDIAEATAASSPNATILGADGLLSVAES